MDFYSRIGPGALGSRLRRLADKFTAEAEHIYQLYETNLDPRWFPVFFMLTEKDKASISELAEDIGQSHASVSQVVRDMVKADIAQREKSPTDARVSSVSLSEKGRAVNAKLSVQCQDISAAMEALLSATHSKLWAELDSLEFQLEEESLLSRVSRVRKERERQAIAIVPYHARYAAAFKTLNTAWITQYWTMEESDIQTLEHPQETIIDQGGYIAIALYDGEPVGTCALVRESDDQYELVKMGVSPQLQGRGIGYLLGLHVIEQAKLFAAKSIRLETNKILQPAVALYRKLGFTPQSRASAHFSRCNLHMERVLSRDV